MLYCYGTSVLLLCLIVRSCDVPIPKYCMKLLSVFMKKSKFEGHSLKLNVNYPGDRGWKGGGGGVGGGGHGK